MSTWDYNRYKDYTGGTAAVTGDFGDRHKSSRIKENIWQQGAIGNIEDFLSTVKWDQLGTDPTFSQQEKTNVYNELQQLHKDSKTYKGDISTLTGDLGTARSDIDFLQERLDNWDTTTEVGDVVGLDDVLKNLKSDYQSDIKDVETQLGDYLKTGDFNTRMTDNLDALGKTLRGEFGDQIGALDIEGVRQSIEDQGGDLSKLTTDFAGLSTDMEWLKGLDLGGLDSRIQGDLTDLQNLLETDRGKELSDLETQLGKDRAADLLDLKTKLESGTASDIEAMAGNLRQEFGDDVFDLSTTFEGKLGDVKSALGDDISSLFSKSDTLQSGIDTLTSGLGTTSQQLAALEGSFGDYKTDAATNLANVEAAFTKQLGDQGTDFTSKLSDLQSSTAQDLLGLRGDVESDRAKAISDLDTTWSGKLQAQDKRLQDQFTEGAAAFNKRLTDISQSNTNYRTLGDSAQGVKIRRSRAYNTGRTRSGTGQLGRSMKISTLNI